MPTFRGLVMVGTGAENLARSDRVSNEEQREDETGTPSTGRESDEKGRSRRPKGAANAMPYRLLVRISHRGSSRLIFSHSASMAAWR